MVNENDGGKKESRPPSLNDLTDLCRSLNDADAKYIVIGGMAMIESGFVRATEDIDLLVEPSPKNQVRIRTALMKLPDQAVREVTPDDLEKYAVVRVADEFVVDLMISACGVRYEEASRSVQIRTIQDVHIPFATPELMWRLKQTRREKDRMDVMFLKELLNK